jgi:hypothetical protein
MLAQNIWVGFHILFAKERLGIAQVRVQPLAGEG